jgi:hypothetical protein
MDNGNETAALPEEPLAAVEADGVASPWRRAADTLRDLWLTARRGLPERRYAERTLKRIARGELRDTLGAEVRDEAATRKKAEQWLARLVEIGLRPDHLCVEYGCGSLWCAEPVIRYLQPGRFFGLDVTDGFYEFGRRRLEGLLSEKQARLAVISRRSLGEVAALKPDFVFSHRVLHHVPWRGLARYMRSLCSLLNEQTVLVIEHMPRPLRDKKSIRAPRYGVADIQSHLPRNWTCRAYPFGFIITHRNRSGGEYRTPSAAS